MELKHSEVDEYLENICSFIKNKRVHKEIRKELKNHIEGLFNNYKNLGKSDNEALKLALKDLGESKDIGENLNRVHKEKIDFKLFIIVLLLVIIGFIGTFTFSNADGYIGILANQYIFRDSIYLIIAIGTFFIGAKINFIKLKKKFMILYVPLLFLSVFLLCRGVSIDVIDGGGGRGINPLIIDSLIPILFLFSLSVIYEKLNFKKITHNIIAIALGIIPLSVLAYISNSVPMFIYYGISLIVIAYICSKNMKFIAIVGLIEIILFYLIMIKTFLAMLKFDKLGYTFKVFKSIKLFGRGERFFYLNSSYPIDSIFGYLGIFCGVIIIIALLYLVFRVNKAAYEIKNNYGKSLAFVVSIVISVEIIWGILMNLNILPYAGVSTLFISFNGLNMVFSLGILGFLNNIYKVKNISNI